METIQKAKLVLIDNRILDDVHDSLLPFAKNIIGFKSEYVTYNAVSCHPDVFIHQGKKINTIAPNTPIEIIQHFDKANIPYRYGEAMVGTDLKSSTPYNCIATEKSLLHKKGFTDCTVLKNSQHLTFINLPQAYARCTTLVLRDGVAISSDLGVQKSLCAQGWDVLYFKPSEIRIVDHRNGFFGGCCGIFNKTVFTLGNPLLHKDGKAFLNFITSYGFKLHALTSEKLYDGGGILFF